MQFPGQQKPPLGVVYLTTMSRPDSALALALLYGYEGKREARLGAVAVIGSGLGAAAFCDAVGRFYAGPGSPSNSNRVLPVGLAADGKLPPDPEMVKVAANHLRTVYEVSDTSEVLALIRNALTAQADANVVIVLSAPPDYLLRELALPGVKQLIIAKVKTLIIVESPDLLDSESLRRLRAEWPTPIVTIDQSIGDTVPYPAASIEKDFAWAAGRPHPVVDAYRAYKPMPYDAPSYDMAGMLYAIHPELPFWVKQGKVALDPAQKENLLKAYIETASAKPVPRRQFRPQAAEVKK
jgi:purine nucleosidase